VSIVIADLTAAACCGRSAIRNLLQAHRQATARGRQVRFAIRPGGPLHQITGFAGTRPLLAAYPTLQHAPAGRSPIPPGDRAAFRRPPGAQLSCQVLSPDREARTRSPANYGGKDRGELAEDRRDRQGGARPSSPAALR
jgi:hypothetical protein